MSTTVMEPAGMAAAATGIGAVGALNPGPSLKQPAAVRVRVAAPTLCHAGALPPCERKVTLKPPQTAMVDIGLHDSRHRAP